MNNQENISLPINHHTFIIKDSDIDFEISSGLLGQKYHSNLSLKFYLSDQSNIPSLARCLSNLNHLNSLDITINSSLANQDYSINEVLIALKSFSNLRNFSLAIEKQSDYFNYDELLIDFADLLNLTKLQIFSLKISSYDWLNQEGRQSLVNAIKNLKYLEELKLNLSFYKSFSENDLNELFASVNQLPNLKVLSYKLFAPIRKQVFKNQLRLDNLNQLQVLSINQIKNSQLSLTELSGQLKQLFTLIRLSIDLQHCILQDEVNVFLNTAFTLRNLEKFDFQLNCILNNKSIAIGEEVCQDSNIKHLMIWIKDTNVTSNRQFISFCPQIKNLKNIEHLYLWLDNINISQESVSALSEWKREWTFLKELSFDSYYKLSPNKPLHIHKFFGDCFSHSHSLTKLTLQINPSNSKFQNSDLLSGLGQLSNLESLHCYSLFDEKSECLELEQKYLTCFQRNSQLRELVFDCIETEEEILYIGKSLTYLQKLEKLHVNLNSIYKFKYLNIFCENFAKLTDLISFKFNTCNLSVDQEDYMNLSHIQMLLKGISELINLKFLILQPEVQDIDQSLYRKELQRCFDSLKEIVFLRILENLFKLSKQKLIKTFKKLVTLKIE